MDWESFFGRDNYESRRDLAYTSETFNLTRPLALCAPEIRQTRSPRSTWPEPTGRAQPASISNRSPSLSARPHGPVLSPSNTPAADPINGINADEAQQAEAGVLKLHPGQHPPDDLRAALFGGSLFV